MNKVQEPKPSNKMKHYNGTASKDAPLSYADRVESTNKWYKGIVEDPESFSQLTEQEMMDLKDEAKKCYDSETTNYNIKNSNVNSDYQWMKTMMAKGTVSDKVAAYTVLIQDDPVHNLHTLRNVVGMVKVGKKNICSSIIDNLTELFLNDLLITDHKLKTFDKRPLSLLSTITSGNAIARRKYLSYWYFEDQLKEVYNSFVVSLNTVAQDSLETNKERAIAAMYKLLAGNPEQEAILLTYLVNKLGDPSKKVASKVIYCLTQLLYHHSNMQGVVLTEIEKLLFRINMSTRTQYYGLCFLSKYYLSTYSTDIARRLIEVYFSFFRACVKKGEIDSRMMSALLMGVNRAYPYAQLEVDKVSEHIDTIYRVVHVANFNVSLHALSLLFQVSDCANNINDRFYSALYKKLLDPEIGASTHHAILLSLVFRALKKDTDENRVKVFFKRLLQISLYMQPPFVCGILFLISQLIRLNQNLNAFTSKESVKLKLEIDDEDDDEEERYTDKKEEVTEEDDNKDDIEIKEEDVDENGMKVVNKSSSGWLHYNKTTNPNGPKYDEEKYNSLQRNPKFAGGAHCAYVELDTLQNHFHPTVSLFAAKLLKGETISYSGDPLKDFMLVRFLERFVFKNPKKDTDITKDAVTNNTFGQRKLYKPVGVRSLAVNSANYVSSDEKKIPVDERFLYKFVQLRNIKGKDEDADDSDADSVASDEFEEMLYKIGGQPKEEEDIDFMGAIGDSLKQKKSKKRSKDDDDEDDEDDDEDEDGSDVELSGEENDFGDEDIDDLDENEEGFDDDDDDLDMNDEDKELLGDLSDEDDAASDIEFGSENDDDDDLPEIKNKSSKKKKKYDSSSLFASADEFATLLEDEGHSATAPGSSNVYANKDKADLKQISWEEKRNRWVKGFDKAVGKKQGSKSFSPKGSKNFSNKSKNNDKSKFKNKKTKY